jgi:hypothetical protein
MHGLIMVTHSTHTLHLNTNRKLIASTRACDAQELGPDASHRCPIPSGTAALPHGCSAAVAWNASSRPPRLICRQHSARVATNGTARWGARLVGELRHGHEGRLGNLQLTLAASCAARLHRNGPRATHAYHPRG